MCQVAGAAWRLHAHEERCARWLLQFHDRVPGDAFRLTQEYLALMLGLARPSVTVVVGALQRAGLLTILDRAGLEAAAYECYAISRAETERLLGPVLGPTGAGPPGVGGGRPRKGATTTM